MVRVVTHNQRLQLTRPPSISGPLSLQAREPYILAGLLARLPRGLAVEPQIR